MIRRLAAIQSAVSAAFIRTWPWLPEKLNDFFGSFAITLPACWLSYAFVFSMVRCLGFAVDCAEIGGECAELRLAGGCLIVLFLSPLLLALPPIIHDDSEPVTTYGLETLLAALVLAFAWTAIRIWRRVV